LSWIEVHEEFRTHPKVAHLAIVLGVSKAESRGYVIGLWLWAATYAPDGDLSRFDSKVIADGCDYTGEKDFKAALIQAEWVDRETCMIHDWHEYGLKMLQNDAAKQRRYRRRVDEAAAREEAPALKEAKTGVNKELGDGDVSVTSPLRDGPVEITNHLDLDHNQDKDQDKASSPLEGKIARETLGEDCQRVVDWWNVLAMDLRLKRISRMTDLRRVHIRQRLREPDFELDVLSTSIRGSPFLQGKNPRGWKVDFDWLIESTTNYVKVLEGKYENGNGNGHSATGVGGRSPGQHARRVPGQAAGTGKYAHVAGAWQPPGPGDPGGPGAPGNADAGASEVPAQESG
jgi:hypothetical protein